MNPKYVIQRTHKETGFIEYLSPGKVNWISEETHSKYRTRYGKWVWGEAEEISHGLNKKFGSVYLYVPLPAKNHI